MTFSVTESILTINVEPSTLTLCTIDKATEPNLRVYRGKLIYIPSVLEIIYSLRGFSKTFSLYSQDGTTHF